MALQYSEIGFIFDWDGVIVDSSRQHEESWDRLSAQEGLPLFEGHFKQGFGKRNEWIIRNGLKWTSDEAEIARLGDEKEIHYRRIVRETGLAPLPGVNAFLKAILAAGSRSVVGSSTPRENIDAVMDIADLHGMFQDIVAAGDVSQGKPHPEVFLKAAGKLGIDPARCVVFEDSFSGIEAGLAGGMKVVALATTNPVAELENKGVAFVARSFEEITLERIRGLFV